MADDRFLWKPISEGNLGNSVALTPSSLVGNINSVYIEGPNGERVEARYGGEHNGGRGHWYFPNTGNQYADGRIIIESSDGSQYDFSLGTGERFESTFSGNSFGDPVINSGGPGSLAGGSSTILQSEGGNQAALAGEADFYLDERLVSFEEGLDAAREQGEENLANYLSNFDLSDELTQQVLNSEVSGLEAFVPRAANLIREQDSGTNENTLLEVGRFNQVNREAVNAATANNVAQRTEVFNRENSNVRSNIRDLQDIVSGSLGRAETLAEGRLPDDLLDDQLSRSARVGAADSALTGGFGVNSARSRNLLDERDLDTRLELMQRGETNIVNSVNQFSNLLNQQRDFYNTVEAPGIINFNPIQPTPVVTDIGGQISPTPTRDAGSIRTNLANTLQGEQSISPSSVLSSELSTQKFNSGVYGDLSDFEQSFLNAEAAGLNNLYDIDRSDELREEAFDRYEAGREEAQEAQGISGWLELGGSVLGGVFSGISLDSIPGIGGGIDLKDVSEKGGMHVVERLAKEIFSGKGIPDSINGDVVESFVQSPEGIKLALESGELVALSEVSPVTAAALPYAAIAAAAAVTGRGVYETVQGLLDGEVTDNDIKRGISSIGGGSFVQGLNDMTGEIINPNTLSDIMLLTNPYTAPFVFLDTKSLWGSGKSFEQQQRDNYRDQLQELGVLSEDFKITLADGSQFDVGLDGGGKLDNIGTNTDGKTQRSYFDVDFSNEITPEVIGFTNPLSAILFGRAEDQAGFTGHLVNAFTSTDPTNVEVARTNAIDFANKAGISYSSGLEKLSSLLKSGKINKELYNAYAGGWRDLMMGGV